MTLPHFISPLTQHPGRPAVKRLQLDNTDNNMSHRGPQWAAQERSVTTTKGNQTACNIALLQKKKKKKKSLREQYTYIQISCLVCICRQPPKTETKGVAFRGWEKAEDVARTSLNIVLSQS